LLAGYLYYQRKQHGVREEALTKAIQVQEAPVGPRPTEAPVPHTGSQGSGSPENLSDLRQIRRERGGRYRRVLPWATSKRTRKAAEAEKSFQEAGRQPELPPRWPSSRWPDLLPDGRSDLGRDTARADRQPTISFPRNKRPSHLARYLSRRSPPRPQASGSAAQSARPGRPDGDSGVRRGCPAIASRAAMRRACGCGGAKPGPALP